MTAQIATGTAPSTRVAVRDARPEDAEVCGRIFYDAFESIAGRHNFPVEPASPEFTRFVVGRMLGTEGYVGLVAELDGETVGSLFVDDRTQIAGIGPVTVDPAAQDDGVGRALMEAALDHERERGAAGVRLVQTAYHYRSFALYAKLGFAIREPLSVVQGAPPAVSSPGRGVRPARTEAVAACAALCERIHGHDRTPELLDAIAAGTAAVVERPDRISGYATGFCYGWHAVAETNEDLVALLASPDAYMGLGVLVPSRNTELLGWCLSNGLKIVQSSTLMTTGLYNEPTGAWLPSIAY